MSPASQDCLAHFQNIILLLKEKMDFQSDAPELIMIQGNVCFFSPMWLNNDSKESTLIEAAGVCFRSQKMVKLNKASWLWEMGMHI